MTEYDSYPNVPSPSYGVPDIEDLCPSTFVCSYCGGRFPLDKIHQCVEQLDQEWEDYESPNYIEPPAEKKFYEPIPHTPCTMSKQPDHEKMRRVVDASFQASPFLKEFIGKNSYEHVNFLEYRTRCSDFVSGVEPVHSFFSYVAEGAKVKENFIVDGIDFDNYERDNSPPSSDKPQSALDYMVVNWFDQSFFYFERFASDIERSLSSAGYTDVSVCPIYCGSLGLKEKIRLKLDEKRYPFVEKPEDAWIYIADRDFSMEVSRQAKATWALAWLAQSVVECQGGFAAKNPDNTVDIHHLTTGRGRVAVTSMKHRITRLADYGRVATTDSRTRHSYHPSSSWDKKETVKPRFDKSGRKIAGGTYPSLWSTTVGVMKIFHHNTEIEYYRPPRAEVGKYKVINHPWRVMPLENLAGHFFCESSLFFKKMAGDLPVHWFVQLSKDRAVLCVNTGSATYYKVDSSGSNSKLSTHGHAIWREGILVNPMTYGVSGKTGLSPSPYANEFTIRALNRFGGYRFVKSRRIRPSDFTDGKITRAYWSFSGNHPNALVVSNAVYHGPFCGEYNVNADHSFFYPPLASTPKFDEWASSTGLNDYKELVLSKAV